MLFDPNNAWINQALIEISLSDARPTADEIARGASGTEERRIAAVGKLRALYKHPPVPPLVRAFFDLEWLYILGADDPAAAAAEFFNGKRQRGCKPCPDIRNLEIAIAVQKHINAGKTVQVACERVEQTDKQANRIGSWERIREIYYGTGDEEEKRIWRQLVKAEAERVTETAADASERDKPSD